MKKFVFLLMTMLMVLALAACGSKQETPAQSAAPPADSQPSGGQTTPSDDPFADGPEVTLIFTTTADPGTTMGASCEYFSKLANERSNGKIKMDIYYSGQLGGNVEATASLKAGDIDLGMFPLDGTFANELAVLDLPFTYTLDQSTLEVLQSSELRDMMDDGLAKSGLKLMSIAPTEVRLTGGQTPIYKLEDFKAWKVRTLENPTHVKLWECLGAAPTPLPVGECYVALQQGVINAYDNCSDAHVRTKIYEQEKYIMASGHNMYNVSILMNLNKFNSLPEAYQEVLMSCEKEVADYERKLATENNAQNDKIMADYGVQFLEISDELRNDMLNAVQPVIQDIRAQAGDEIVDCALRLLGKT